MLKTQGFKVSLIMNTSPNRNSIGHEKKTLFRNTRPSYI